MEVKFAVTKEGRKALVSAAGEITGWAPVYKGAPSFAFAVGNYIIDRNGALIYDERMGAEDARRLLTGLAERGFAFEGDIDEIAPVASEQAGADGGDSGHVDDSIGDGGDAGHNSEGEGDSGDSGHDIDGEPSGSGILTEASADDGSGKLVINTPLLGFSVSAIDNLEKLVAAKAWIIQKMTGADALPIERDENYLRFPWFNKEASPAEADAYARLVARLCETAKEKQRVTSTERRLEDGDNEKFKARCFLLSLGFIGKEYAQARKILLAPMSGSGSFKSGDQKKPAAPEGAAAADSGVGNAEAVNIRGDGSGADSAATGGTERGDCLACGQSMSDPAENDGDSDRLFCVIKQDYVDEDGSCEEFNRQGVAVNE